MERGTWNFRACIAWNYSFFPLKMSQRSSSFIFICIVVFWKIDLKREFQINTHIYQLKHFIHDVNFPNFQCHFHYHPTALSMHFFQLSLYTNRRVPILQHLSTFISTTGYIHYFLPPFSHSLNNDSHPRSFDFIGVVPVSHSHRHHSTNPHPPNDVCSYAHSRQQYAYNFYVCSIAWR